VTVVRSYDPAQVMVGGCDSTKRLQMDGELAKMLRAAGVKVQTPQPTNRTARAARYCVLLTTRRMAVQYGVQWTHRPLIASLLRWTPEMCSSSSRSAALGVLAVVAC
jgi:hypothetical protein